MYMFKFLWAFLNVPNGGRGQAMTEYILIISIISVGLIVAAVLLKDQISKVFKYVVQRLGGQGDAELEQTEWEDSEGPYDDAGGGG
ncbi:MAG: hypothetical protein ABIH04_00190 [Planctomycetota bacterium]